MPRLTVLLTATATSLLVLPLLAVAGLGGSSSTACTHATATATTTPDGSTTPTSSRSTTVGTASATDIATAADPTNTAVTWNTQQLNVAQTIITVGANRGIDPWGWVVAVAIAIQESQLRNPPGGNSDPNVFYDALLAIPGWQQMPVTRAARAVQNSAAGGDPTDHTQDAIGIVVQIAARLKLPLPPILQDGERADGCLLELLDEGEGLPTTASARLPAGFTLPDGTPGPVTTAITWAIGQLGTPYSFGGDCTDPHGGNPAHECDCSSLVQMAYAAAGITIPRTTILQRVHAGIPVTGLSQLRPGDLIFIPGSLGTAAEPRHVGIYIGNDLILNAPGTGQTVRLTALARWASEVALIRRVVPFPTRNTLS